MWLLGALGIGGIGAALFLVPGLAANALKALGALLDVVRDHPWQVAVAASLALSGWLWWGKGNAIEERDAAVAGRKADRAAYTAAQAEALRLALAAKAATEARYKAHAERIDRDHETELADARDATADYIARNRVRGQGAGSATGGTATAADNRGPGVLPEMPAGSFVAVSDVDVQRCSDATAYALSAREWALGLAR